MALYTAKGGDTMAVPARCALRGTNVTARRGRRPRSRCVAAILRAGARCASRNNMPPPHATTKQETMLSQSPLLHQAALDAARPFLHGEEEAGDEVEAASILRAAGAGECWHKHGTFLDHLMGVHRILRLWGAPDAVARCGLFHSAYSNSYTNLALFPPDDTGRARVRAAIGAPAERLAHLFCSIPRHALLYDGLLSHYTDQELRADLERSAASLQQEARRRRHGAADGGGGDEPWRRKIQELLPAAGGVTVKHIRTGEDVVLPRRVVAAFLLVTMADFSDQFFDWQDSLFDNADGHFEFRGNAWTTFWPGTGKPGLWVSSISRMAALYALIARDEEIRNTNTAMMSADQQDEDHVALVIPPVFRGCTKVLGADDQKVARDLYWEAVCGVGGGDDWRRAEQLLKESIARNPFVGEPHLVLAQVYMNMEWYGEAQEQAEQGLKLLLEWGSSWDKRVPWEGWVSWGRAMIIKAQEKDWPHTSFGILGIGLVK